jgi:hypothetical protein
MSLVWSIYLPHGIRAEGHTLESGRLRAERFGFILETGHMGADPAPTGRRVKTFDFGLTDMGVRPRLWKEPVKLAAPAFMEGDDWEMQKYPHQYRIGVGRNDGNLGSPRQLIHCIRRYQYWLRKKRDSWTLLRRWHTLRHNILGIITGAEIELETRIGGGLRLIHTNGIVNGPDAEMGPNCLIFHQVTIVATGKGDKPGMPKLGGHVEMSGRAQRFWAVS